MSMMSEFKEFALKGNVMDFIMPLVSFIAGGEIKVLPKVKTKELKK